jgi:hypothetical protein
VRARGCTDASTDPRTEILFPPLSTAPSVLPPIVVRKSPRRPHHGRCRRRIGRSSQQDRPFARSLPRTPVSEARRRGNVPRAMESDAHPRPRLRTLSPSSNVPTNTSNVTCLATSISALSAQARTCNGQSQKMISEMSRSNSPRRTFVGSQKHARPTRAVVFTALCAAPHGAEAASDESNVRARCSGCLGVHDKRSRPVPLLPPQRAHPRGSPCSDAGRRCSTRTPRSTRWR